MTTAPAIPLVDVASLEPGDPRVGVALEASGFAVLEGHGLDRELWSRTYAAAGRAFALPDEVKDRYRGPQDGSQRGYLPLRTTLPDGGDPLDRKECWHARQAGHRFANLLPEEVPELEPATLALVRELDGLVDRVLDSIDAFLGHPAGRLAATVHGSDSLFRINHYPDARADGGEVRFRPHRDFDLITLLLGADRPGLEVEGRDGTWHGLVPSEAGIVVNAGDILELESDGRIPSTTHRVVTPADPDGGRMSMVYFVSPRADLPLPTGITAGELIDARLRDAGYLA